MPCSCLNLRDVVTIDPSGWDEMEEWSEELEDHLWVVFAIGPGSVASLRSVDGVLPWRTVSAEHLTINPSAMIRVACGSLDLDANDNGD
jgi:hypothetical protein